MDLKDVHKISDRLGLPCVIPFVKVLRNTGDISPADVYVNLAKKKDFTFLLESAELGEKIARYSFLGSDPEKIISLKNGKFEINGETLIAKNPLKSLEELIFRYNVHSGKLPKFFGGLLGYFSYDMVRYFEDIGSSAKDLLKQPDAQFIFIKDLIAFDHWREEILLISNLILEKAEDIEREFGRANEKVSIMESQVKSSKKMVTPEIRLEKNLRVKSNFEKENYEGAVKTAKKHIYAGDIFQVVLSQRFEVEGAFDPFEVYLALKTINPSPYMYLLDFGKRQIIGSSPEILVKVDDETVTIRPIAGTRPRGSDIVEDESLGREMLNDDKERAEHVMLVDLGRNDIGRVSKFGSVGVTEFFGIEKYSHVQHIISNVKGELREGLNSFDALEAAFPAGTVTGAPKVRAMEIIEDLEPSRRGIYAGSVGYFSFGGNMDFAITIRTIVLEKDRAFVQAGAGIVADSVPEREYVETLNKGKGMIRALKKAGVKS